MSPSQHRIFVSHSHLDNAFGTRLTQDLRRVLKDESAVFYDVLGLHGGQDWWDTIVEELTARDVFLLVLSPDAMNSIWVRREINIAINEGKYLLPALFRSCNIRADLKILQIISFLAPKTYETAFQEILVALALPTETPVEVTEPKERVSQLPDPAHLLLNHLEAAFAAQDWPDVIRKATFLIERLPASASATVYRMQGVALLEEGEQQQAHEAFETALALVSERERELRLTLLSDDTALLAQQEQWSRVLQRAKEALRLVPNDPGWLATQQQAQSQLVKPAPLLTPTPVQVSPKNLQPAPLAQKTKEQWVNEGLAFRGLKQYEEAIAAYDQALRLDPNYALAYQSKGYDLDELKRYEEAVAAYDQAIHLNPNDAKAYYNKGVSLKNLKRHEEAIAAYNQAIRLNPNYAKAYYNKGNVLRELKRYEEAIAVYDQAIRLNPDYATAYHNKGVSLEDLGKRKEAQQAYERARQLGHRP